MMPGIACAPGQNPGRRLSGVTTDGAVDAQQIDVPAHDEQRVRNTHCTRITCNEPGCPGSVQDVDGLEVYILGHTVRNMGVRARIPCSSRTPSQTANGTERAVVHALAHGASITGPSGPIFSLVLPSGGVRAAHTATTLGRTFVLVQPTPRTVFLRPRHRVVQTFKPHRASSADTFSLALPDLSLRLTLAVRTEEEQQVLTTARGSILPTPVRAGKHGRLPTYLRHGSITSTKMHQIVRYSGTSEARAREPVLSGNLRCKIQRVLVTWCSRT